MDSVPEDAYRARMIERQDQPVSAERLTGSVTMPPPAKPAENRQVSTMLRYQRSDVPLVIG